MIRTSRLLIGAALLGPLAWAGAARAQNCSDATMFPNPIVMTGSSAIEPTLAKMALKLAAQNVTIIYKPTASCDGPNAIMGDAPLAGNGDYYAADPDPTKPPLIKTCSLDAVPTKPIIGISDVSFKSCIGPLPAGLGDFQAMVQSMLIVVPEANTTTTALSADQAQTIWGCGMKGAFGAFTDENAIQQRNSQSGTQIMIATYLGLPPDAMKGKMNAKTGDLVTSLLSAATTNPMGAIGFVAADAYETRRAMLNAVAFKGTGQSKAYLPDSDANSTDKINVRDGHYMIQGPVHLITKVDGSGNPTDAAAKKTIDWLQGNTDVELGKPATYIDIVAGVGNVPLCAMKVRRENDGGFLGPYAPAKSCGCYFEKVATNKTPDATKCPVCTDSSTCGAKKCNFGFCE
jgi:hypothetical protein